MNNKLFYVNILESEDICVESISVSPCAKFLGISHGNNIALYDFKTSRLLAKLSDKNEDSSFRSLIWIPRVKSGSPKLSEYRFISVGLHGVVTEWDLVAFKPKIECLCFGGAIFSGALGPNLDLYLGCDDGNLRLFSLYSGSRDSHAHGPDSGEEIEFKSVLIRHNAPILSVLCSGKRVFCGTANSQILVFEQGSASHKSLRLKSGSYFRSKRRAEGESNPEEKEVNVWSLLCLDNQLLSGDSEGNVVVWDLETLTVSQVLSQHTNDVTSLAPVDASCFVSGGLDSRLVMYARPGPTVAPPGASLELGEPANPPKWSVRAFKYPLRGDIRALCTTSTMSSQHYPLTRSSPGTTYISGGDPIGVHSGQHGDVWILCAGSGGCVSMCKSRNFLKSKRSVLLYPNLDTFNTVKMSASRQRVLVQYLKRVELWHVSLDSPCPLNCASTTTSASSRPLVKGGANSEGYEVDELGVEEEMKQICKICSINLKGVVRVSSISPGGDAVAVLTQGALKIFRLAGLKIEPSNFPHSHLNILNVAFISNQKLLIHYHHSGGNVSGIKGDVGVELGKLGYGLAVYNLNDSTLEKLEHLEVSSYIYKMLLLTEQSEQGEKVVGVQGVDLDHSSAIANGGTSKDGGISTGDECGLTGTLIALFCTDGDAYLLELGNRGCTRLPRLPGSIISAVAPNSSLSHLLVISSSFQYYCYNIRSQRLENLSSFCSTTVGTSTNIGGEDEVRRIEAKGVVSNCYWVHDVAIVETTSSIFYFKPLGPSSAPSSEKGGSGSGKVVGTEGERRKVWIGPRRLCNVPSINAQHTPDSPETTPAGQPTGSLRSRVNFLARNKFIVHCNIVTPTPLPQPSGAKPAQPDKASIALVVFKKRVNLDVTPRVKKYGN